MANRHFALSLATLALCLAAAAPAAGQIQNRPAREGGTGLFGGGQERPAQPRPSDRTRQEMSVTLNFLGAHDELSRSGGVSGGAPGLGAVNARTAGVLDSNFRYHVGRTARWFEATGSGSVTAYENERALVGGEVRASGISSFGRRNRLEAAQSLRDAPSTTLGEFGSLTTAIDSAALTDGDPSIGLSGQRTRTLSSSAVYVRTWSSRQTTTVTYNFLRNDYNPDGVGFDSRANSGDVRHQWRLSRTAGLRLAYNAARTSYVERASGDMTNRNAAAGIDYSRRISPTRQITFGANAGAAYVETLSASTNALRGSWGPSGSGNIRVDLGRTWAVTADYRRAATVLEQVALETFWTDVFALSTGGLVGRRLDFTFTGGTSRGDMPAGAGASGAFESYTASAQLRWAITRWAATTFSYSFYDYELRNVDVPQGIPARSRQNGVRVGMTFWLPIIGARPATAPER